MYIFKPVISVMAALDVSSVSRHLYQMVLRGPQNTHASSTRNTRMSLCPSKTDALLDLFYLKSLIACRSTRQDTIRKHGRSVFGGLPFPRSQPDAVSQDAGQDRVQVTGSRCCWPPVLPDRSHFVRCAPRQVVAPGR